MRKRKKMNAHKKDIWRSIWKGKKRFFSIMVITFLGTMMFSGLKAACVDLRHSADNFFDRQRLFDLCIMSTLGLTDEDLAVIQGLEEVERAEGIYSETVRAIANGNDLSVALKPFYTGGMNQPYVIEGHLPEEANEVAVTEKFAKAAGIGVGDSLEISEDLEEDEEASFSQTQYQVSAIIIDALDINNAGGTVSFRTASTEEDTLYILPEVVNSDIYTSIYITLKGSSELFCYGEDYEAQVSAFSDYIEAEIKQQRAETRTEEVRKEAYEELEKAQQEVYDELSKAEQELLEGEAELETKLQEALEALQEGEAEFQTQIAEALAQLQQGEQELADGERQLDEAEQELNRQQAEAETAFAAARQEILDGYVQLEEGQTQLDLGAAQLALGEAALKLSKESLQEQENTQRAVLAEERAFIEEQLADNRAMQARLQEQIDNSTSELDKFVAEQELNAYKAAETLLLEGQESLAERESEMDAQYAQEWAELNAQEQELADSREQLEAGQAELDNGRAQLEAGLVELETQEAFAEEQFEAGRAQIAAARLELQSGKSEIAAGWEEYESGKAEGEAQLEEGRKEYEEGEAEGREQLEQGRLEFEGGKADAEAELENARRELADMDVAEWYIQDRNSLGGYSNVKSDADSIESIGTVFPIVFFVVAILISLTTITRMVEEDRGLIGTYKALGFYNSEIRRKYLLYAFCASGAGSILGTLGAFILLPGIIFYIFSTMYLLPEYVFLFDKLNGILGPVIFVGGIVVATVIACRNELKQTPVALMRPKTPRSGSRVFLERIPYIWNRLSFLNKVTARNLFRYKKRLLMTISGIMGCMALLLFGFAIKDSVTDLVPRQYDRTFLYDAMAVGAGEGIVSAYLEGDKNVSEYLNAVITSVKLENTAGITETVQLIVAPDGESLTSYIQLRDTSGKEIQLKDGDVALTQNASILLDVKEGSAAGVQTMELDRAEVEVTHVVQNYLGNYLYMTEATYEQYFGECAPNGALIHISEDCKDPVLYCNALGKQEGIVTCLSTDETKDEFSSAFTLINMVVYIIIIMAASLAFAVLFTLATTNISERTRELATIKVLGFYDTEVHLYVNKETMILTGIGIFLGVPLGYAFAQTLTAILSLPSIYLAVSLHPGSYLIAGGLSLFFAILVNMITDRSLDAINPVEALKSVE